MLIPITETLRVKGTREGWAIQRNTVKVGKPGPLWRSYAWFPTLPGALRHVREVVLLDSRGVVELGDLVSVVDRVTVAICDAMEGDGPGTFEELREYFEAAQPVDKAVDKLCANGG